MTTKVLITTSGTGSRLGQLTKKVNKALILVGGRPALFYLLDQFPTFVPIVLTVGYLAEQVVETVRQAYPDRDLQFVPVSPFEGLGSSLGYSLLQAAPYLQTPFIYQACDTLVAEPLPEPNRNWVAGYQPPKEFDATAYRTHLVDQDGLVRRFNDKGEVPFNTIHMGITGVYDYLTFWKILREEIERAPEDSTLSDVHVISKMLDQGCSFGMIPFSVWNDTGNPEALKKTQTFFEQH